MNCIIRIAKTKALISFAVTAKLICVFVFAYAKSRFSHDAAQIKSRLFMNIVHAVESRHKFALLDRIIRIIYTCIVLLVYVKFLRISNNYSQNLDFRNEDKFNLSF